MTPGAPTVESRPAGAEAPPTSPETPATRDSTDPNSPTNPLDRLAADLAAEIEQVDALIRARMSSEYAPRIPEVTAHLVGAGGKRLRPLLTLAAARACGAEGPDPVRLAASVEFIHTATLLHDDVVDESDMRRGRPTANLLWDNKSSVLVGDYLFARSFELMVETGSIQALEVLSRASASIAEGEVLQLSAARDLGTGVETYLKIARGKTASLFAAAAQVGALVAGAPDSRIEAFREYGDALGIAFQIADDLLDYRGDATATGKDVGDDFRARKLTLPAIHAVASARGDDLEFWQRAISKGDQRDGDLEHALRLMDACGALDRARDDALDWSGRARGALARLPSHPILATLDDLAGFVVARLA